MLQEYQYEEIYLSYALDDYPEDKHHFMHIHDRCEIFFILSGDISYLVEGSHYTLDSYDLMIMRPAEAHRAKILNSTRYERYVINLPLSFVDRIDPEGRLKQPFNERPLGKGNLYHFSESEARMILKLFQDMNQKTDEYERNLSIRTHLPLLLDMIYRKYKEQECIDSMPPSLGERIILYVNRHIFEDLSILGLASHFYLSPSQFSRVFKQATGSSPWDYITQKRLTAAKEKIRSGIPAWQAGADCGFSDYSTFYRAYKKRYGIAPSSNRISSVP